MQFLEVQCFIIDYKNSYNKYFYHIHVIWKSLATTLLLGTIKFELQKAYFLDDLMKP